MAQTFRTDPDTGRTVISQDNVVGRQMASGERVDNRISDGGASVSDVRGGPRRTVRYGYESMNAPTRPGTGYMSRSEFESLSGMTETNPYGKKGFFSRVFGIDPSKVDYTNNLGPQGIENVKIQAYDRFMNPFAQEDAFGRPTMGANFSQGTTRSGVRPGDQTIFGPAASGQAEGIASFLQNMPGIFGMAGHSMAPTVIPGTVGSDARGQDRGIYDFNIPDNMDQLVSSALRQDAFDARDPAAILETIDRGIFTTDDDSPSGAVDYDTVSQFFPAESIYDIESRLDRRRAAPPTVAETILNEPTYTGPFTSQIAEDIYKSGPDTPVEAAPQGTGTGDTSGATISSRPGVRDFERSLEDLERSGARSDFLMDIIEGLRRANPLDEPMLSSQSLAPLTAPTDLTAGVGEELLGTRSTAPVDRTDDPSFGLAIQSMFGPTDVAQMRNRDAEIDAIRNSLIAQGMNPSLAFARARMQVGG